MPAGRRDRSGRQATQDHEACSFVRVSLAAAAEETYGVSYLFGFWAKGQFGAKGIPDAVAPLVFAGCHLRLFWGTFGGIRDNWL